MQEKITKTHQKCVCVCVCVCVWEREICVENLYIEWERKWKIYNKRIRIRRVKTKEDKGIEEDCY